MTAEFDDGTIIEDDEEARNRTAETRESKAFLAMVNRASELLKS